jgi:hypothetical protein
MGTGMQGSRRVMTLLQLSGFSAVWRTRDSARLPSRGEPTLEGTASPPAPAELVDEPPDLRPSAFREIFEESVTSSPFSARL